MSTIDQGALALGPAANTFDFESHIIRVVMRDGEPWFVAVDVCTALQIGNPTMALRALDTDEKALSSIEGLSRGNDHGNLISESGLYTLILRCRDAVKPGTVPHRFRKWVTGEVLPAIRKTGCYSKPECTRELAISVLESTRWFMTVQNGHVVLIPIEPDAYIIRPDEFAKAISRRNGVDLRFMPEILAAVTGRLGSSGLFQPNDEAKQHRVASQM